MIYATLITAVAAINGASFVGIDTHTDVKLTGGKKNPMQGRVTKEMLGASVMVFSNKSTNGYEAMVARRLEQEGKDPTSFTLSERTWGVRIPNLPIVEHKDKYYLEVIFLRPGVVSYFLDGTRIDETDIAGLPNPSEGEQGGLTNKVVVRTFAADSITAIRIDGKEYR